MKLIIVDMLGREKIIDNPKFISIKEAEEDLADRLAGLIGLKKKELRNYLAYSAKGISVTPDGMQHSHADNLVWMLGAYVETRNHESDECYVIHST